MSAALTHHAAKSLASGADKVAALADTLQAYDLPGTDWVVLRLESIAADLRRDAREYESLADSFSALKPLPPFEG